MEVGLQDDAVFLTQAGYTRSAALDRAGELGVRTIRANMIWARVVGQASRRTRPSKPVYDFGVFDTLVAEASARRMRVELTLTGPAPAWATKDRKKIGTRDPSAKEFARFAAAVAAHFRGRVTRYSVWNEPNWHTWLSPAKTAAKQ